MYGQYDNWDILNRLPVKLGFSSKGKIIQIDAGGFHTLALSDQGELFSWGSNDYGPLGQESTPIPNLLDIPSENCAN